METYLMQETPDMKSLVSAAQGVDEPVVVYDGDDECLVAMRPSVFERILFDTHLLNSAGRDAMRL